MPRSTAFHQAKQIMKERHESQTEVRQITGWKTETVSIPKSYANVAAKSNTSSVGFPGLSRSADRDNTKTLLAEPVTDNHASAMNSQESVDSHATSVQREKSAPSRPDVTEMSSLSENTLKSENAMLKNEIVLLRKQVEEMSKNMNNMRSEIMSLRQKQQTPPCSVPSLSSLPPSVTPTPAPSSLSSTSMPTTATTSPSPSFVQLIQPMIEEVVFRLLQSIPSLQIPAKHS
jgi:chromosome condensin MukBEF ATPase and DNA-binding subunit MukB